MKKKSLIIVGLVLTFTFTGCTRGSSASNAGNKPSETVSDNAETESLAENTTEEQATDALVEKPTVSETEAEYNAEEAKKAFEESDIPDSIKNIFLSDGKFIDTQTQKEMKLSEYRLYETTYSYDDQAYTYGEEKCGVAEWYSYIIVDFDNDGKKELFYAFQPEISLHEGTVFHEHTDGKVYVYRHRTLRVNIGENGDVVASYGADFTANTLYRYSFDTEKIIKTEIAYTERQEYYGEGKEISEAEFGSYMKLACGGGMPWTKYIIVQTN